MSCLSHCGFFSFYFKVFLHFSMSKVGCNDAHRKAWQLEHLSMSQPTLIQPYLAHIRGESGRGFPAHFRQYSAKEEFTKSKTQNNYNHIHYFSEIYTYIHILTYELPQFYQM